MAKFDPLVKEARILKTLFEAVHKKGFKQPENDDFRPLLEMAFLEHNVTPEELKQMRHINDLSKLTSDTNAKDPLIATIKGSMFPKMVHRFHMDNVNKEFESSMKRNNMRHLQ